MREHAVDRGMDANKKLGLVQLTGVARGLGAALMLKILIATQRDAATIDWTNVILVKSNFEDR